MPHDNHIPHDYRETCNLRTCLLNQTEHLNLVINRFMGFVCIGGSAKSGEMKKVIAELVDWTLD